MSFLILVEEGNSSKSHSGTGFVTCYFLRDDINLIPSTFFSPFPVSIFCGHMQWFSVNLRIFFFSFNFQVTWNPLKVVPNMSTPRFRFLFFVHGHMQCYSVLLRILFFQFWLSGYLKSPEGVLNTSIMHWHWVLRDKIISKYSVRSGADLSNDD